MRGRDTRAGCMPGQRLVQRRRCGECSAVSRITFTAPEREEFRRWDRGVQDCEDADRQSELLDGAIRSSVVEQAPAHGARESQPFNFRDTQCCPEGNSAFEYRIRRSVRRKMDCQPDVSEYVPRWLYERVLPGGFGSDGCREESDPGVLAGCAVLRQHSVFRRGGWADRGRQRVAAVRTRAGGRRLLSRSPLWRQPIRFF